MFQRAVEKFFLAGGKIIPADNRFVIGQQAVNQGAANESGGAGDENAVHFLLGGV
jgi:hypothetical protein